MKATCVYKYRDSSGKIIGYKIQDANGNTQDIGSIELKNLIVSNEISIDNLTLTSDGRLLSTTPKIENVQDSNFWDSSESDDTASKAAALIGMYKYNTDAKKIVKLDSVSEIIGDPYDHEYAHDVLYNAHYSLNDAKKEQIIVTIIHRDGRYEVAIQACGIRTHLCLLNSNDVLDEFENGLIQKYKIRQSLKASSVAHKLNQAENTENTANTGKKVSIFNLFKR
jgi:hypothetical protein